VDARRRRLLKGGLGGALLLAGGGLLGWRIFERGYGPFITSGEVPIALSVKEFAIVKALVRAILPAEAGFPSGESLGVPQRIDEEVWAAAPALRSDLKAGVQILEHATALHGFPSRFTRLPAADQRVYLEKLLAGSNNTLCLIALALKEMAHLFYYGNEAVWRHIGYDGPLVKTAVPPDSTVAYKALLRKIGSS
jgi:hypothetical protein